MKKRVFIDKMTILGITMTFLLILGFDNLVRVACQFAKEVIWSVVCINANCLFRLPRPIFLPFEQCHTFLPYSELIGECDSDAVAITSLKLRMFAWSTHHDEIEMF